MSSCISPLSRAPTTHSRPSSEPHSYNIQAKLRNGILSIFVHDTMTNCQWRQEFTQISFPSHKLYHVAKALIMAIQTMINSAKSKQVANNMDPKPIAILVYNQWCYLTIQNSQFPSFALRPIQPPNYANYGNKPLPPHTNKSKPKKYTKPNLGRLPFPTRPLPPLPVAHKMSVKAAEQHSYSRSVVKLGQSHPYSHANQHNYAHSMYIPSAPTQKSLKKDMSKPHIVEDDDDAFNSSSDCSDYEDEMVNSEDEDSDSFKYQRMHSNDTSMDSMENTGSLDSLFTNSGSNRFQVDEQETLAHSLSNNSVFSPTKKMKIFNVSMDDESDEEYESVISPMNAFRANTRWINATDNDKRYKQQKKRSKNKLVKKELVICLNGSVIDDLEHHAMEQIVAEEEYYDEEEEQTPDYYDPNYLGVQPYYDD